MRSYVIIGLIALLLFGCVNQVQQPPNTTYTPSVINSSTNQSQAQPWDKTVGLGDTVWVNYTLRVDGKVIDTNDPVLANQSGLLNPNRKYGPPTFVAQQGSGIIPGFVMNVLAMPINEPKEFLVSPEQGYGVYDPKKLSLIPRYYNKSLYETIPRSYFVQNNITISNNTGFDTKFGTVFISDLNDQNVTIYYLGLDKKGATFEFNGLPQEVVNLSNSTVVIEFMLVENQTYALSNPQTGEPNYYVIKGKNDTTITLDANHPLSNKTLDFVVTVLGINHHNQTVGVTE